MPSPNWNDDDELMLDLRQAVAGTAVEEWALGAGRAAFAWRTVDDDLRRLHLSCDSHLDGLAPVRAPAGGSYRILRFTGSDLSIEIEVGSAGIEGQLIPPQPGRITVLTPTGPCAHAVVDDVGCFHFPPMPHGPARLKCTLEAGTFVTDWSGI